MPIVLAVVKISMTSRMTVLTDTFIPNISIELGVSAITAISAKIALTEIILLKMTFTFLLFN